MSSFAKKMLEKYGWKEGEGLGKSREGVKTHIKVIRRDPHTASGLGHLSDPSVINGQLNGKGSRDGSRVYSSEVVELDSVYSSLAAERKRRRRYENSNSSDCDTDSDDSSTDSESDDSNAKTTLYNDKNKSTKLSRFSSSSSSSSSSNQNVTNRKGDSSRRKTHNDNSEDMSTTSVSSPTSLLSDEELFRKCGGVRLGRAGRHRFFEGKLKRISKHNKSSHN